MKRNYWENYFLFLFRDNFVGRLMKVNPFDQPSVELIKTETSKILI